jgi:hypothetical protein
MRNSWSTDCIHINSAIPSGIALYYASVLEHDTVFCFFAHQDIKLGKKIQQTHQHQKKLAQYEDQEYEDIWTVSPISIRKRTNKSRGRFPNMKTKNNGIFQKSQNSLHGCSMYGGQSMKILTHLIYQKRYIGSWQCEILECLNDDPISGSVFRTEWFSPLRRDLFTL